MHIEGTTSRGFEPVRDAFARNFAEHGELGAAVAVYRRGRCVVDFWGGVADRESGRPWRRDTLGIVFSATKGVTATVVHRLAERGVLALDAPVAAYWPEFAAAGKQAITLRDVLTHRAGLAAVEGALTLDEVLGWHAVCAAIARQAPDPATRARHGYHVRSYGWILGEVVRRATGRTLGRVLAEEIAAPLGLAFWVGLPEAHEPRVATLYAAPEPSDPRERALRDRLLGPDTLLGRALAGPSNLFQYGPMWNTRALRAAELPSSNGIGDARSLAKLYAATIGEVGGVRVVGPAAIAEAAREHVSGSDAVIFVPTRFGLGYMLPPTLSPACPEGAFGHPGAGGSLGFADPAHEIGFGYVMNQMQLGMTGDARAGSLVAALYESIAAGA
ncbi:MAG: esterase [Proteobacteria bacterium]|nr:MAG: esterase [Pseudomonadota bacterium]